MTTILVGLGAVAVIYVVAKFTGAELAARCNLTKKERDVVEGTVMAILVSTVPLALILL